MSTSPPNAPLFTIRAEDLRGDLHVHLAGELDLAATAECEAELTRARATAVGRLVIDLSELTFIDSSGLRTIIAACQQSETAGAEVVLLPGPAAVQRVFEMTGLLDRLPFTGDPPASAPAA